MPLLNPKFFQSVSWKSSKLVILGLLNNNHLKTAVPTYLLFHNDPQFKMAHLQIFRALKPLQLLVPGLVMSCFILFGSVSAQLREMDISPIERPSGGIPVFTEHPDEAYVIIESPISNLVFSSNMEGIVEDRSEPDLGRYVLIIRPFTQIFTVNAPGFMVGRFRVQSPQARNTYHYRIRPVEASTEFVPVNFIVEPSGAELFIDDQQVPIGQTVRMEPGPQTLRIENPGYRTIVEEIIISVDNTLFQYTMDELYEIPVTIRSNPSGATVYINTLRRDRETNFQDFFYPGEYLVRLTKSGYRDAEMQINVTEEGPNDFMIEMQRFVGTLSLSVEPTQARVLINNRDYSGQQDIDLAPGIHRLMVLREGYHDHDERIVIEEGEQLVKSVQLNPKTGVLIFTIEQADALIRLYNQDNQLVQQWNGINRLPDLPVGLYRYTASLDGYPELAGQLSIRDGATERVNASFDQVAHAIVQPEAPRDDQAALEAARAAEEERRRQEEIARLEAQQREMREQADRRIQEQQEAQRPAPDPRSPVPPASRGFSAPRSFSGLTISYTDFWLNTEAFENNVQERWGITLGRLRTSRFLAMRTHIGYGRLDLYELTMSQITQSQAEDHINMLLYGLKAGLKLGLGPFNLYGLSGVEGTVMFHEAFVDEMYHMADAVAEIGLLFMPDKWSVGFRGSISAPFDTQEDFYQFARIEVGIIIK